MGSRYKIKAWVKTEYDQLWFERTKMIVRSINIDEQFMGEWLPRRGKQ